MKSMLYNFAGAVVIISSIASCAYLFIIGMILTTTNNVIAGISCWIIAIPAVMTIGHSLLKEAHRRERQN